MKQLVVKILVVSSICLTIFTSCSKEVKKDNSVENDDIRKSAKEAVKELEQQ